MRTFIPLFIAVLALSACGDSSPERLIEDATAQVQRAEAEVEGAKQQVEHKEKGLEDAREELEGAREDLRDAEARLVEAREYVAEVADDAYLFRAVQSALLADPKLEELAISARVRDGVVTLEGLVPNAGHKKRAAELAGAVGGVKRVDNKVQVELAVQ